jgi:hypothetical protein
MNEKEWKENDVEKLTMLVKHNVFGNPTKRS